MLVDMNDREFVEYCKDHTHVLRVQEWDRLRDLVASRPLGQVLSRSFMCEIVTLRLDLADARRERDEALGYIEKAEESIYAAMSPSGWEKSTPQYLASRVTTLANLYLGSVDTIRAFDDKCIALQSALEKARELATAMETCHACKAIVHVGLKSVHCEDGCSPNCEDHEGPECTGIDVLHARLADALAGYATQVRNEVKERADVAIEKARELAALLGPVPSDMYNADGELCGKYHQDTIKAMDAMVDALASLDSGAAPPDRTVKDSLTVEYRCTRCGDLAEFIEEEQVWRHAENSLARGFMVPGEFCDRYGYPIQVKRTDSGAATKETK